MASIIPAGGSPPPANVPGPPPTGPVLELPANLPGGSGGSTPPNTIPGAIPPPPFLAPLDGVTSGATSPNSVVVRIYRWNAVNNDWQSIDWFQEGWQFWPAGWYASAHQDVDGNVDWGPNSNVFLVLERKDPTGVAQPYVIPDPSSATSVSTQCPPNSGLTDLHDPYFGNNEIMCSYVAPPPPQVCPPGYHWDNATEQCVPNIPPPPPPPPPGGPPPPPPTPVPLGQPDPYGDEITRTLCEQMAANAAAIVAAIQALQKSLPGAGNDKCCQNLVTAIGGVVSIIGQIFNLLSVKLSAGTPLDLTPIVTQLTAMASSLATIATAPALDLTPLTTAINDVAKAIASAPPTDVSGIVQQLANLVREGDVKQTILNSLQTEGYLTAADAQVLSGADWADSIVRIFRTWGWTALTWYMRAIGLEWDGTKWVDIGATEGLAQTVSKIVGTTLSFTAAPLYPEIKGLIDAVVNQLSPAFPPTLFNPNVDADLLLTKTLVPALLMNGAMLVCDALGWEISEQLGEYVTLASEFIGLQEVRELQVGQRMKFGPMRYAEHSAKATYMQELPGVGEAAGWLARGLIDQGTAETIMKFNGRHTDLYPNTEQAAQSGMSARQMLRLIETNLFSAADIADELTFAGMRPVSQHRMLLAAPYLATNAQRNQGRIALENAYKEGLIADADLTAQIDSLENNTDRDSLILFALHWDILITETKALVAEYSAMLKVGSYTDAQFRAAAAGLGLQQWKIDMEAGKAEAAANVATYKKNLAEAAALERATAAEERKAAMQGFKSGTLNSAALAAALVLTGLTPTQSAAWVSLAGLQQSGNLRWIYGLLKSPAEASLLRARVSALSDQRKRLQIDDPTFVGALQAMQIPDRYINALRAATDAMITPKTAAVTIPLQTT